MYKRTRQYLPEYLFFCVTFAVISLILRSRYAHLTGVLEQVFLHFGLHFSQWSGTYRSCVILVTDILLTILVFFPARYSCDIRKTSGKRKLIAASLPVIISFCLLAILCELQVFRRDDFWEVQYARDLGMFKYMKLALQTEGGRFFSYFLKGCSTFFRSTPASMLYLNTCLFISLGALFMGLYRLLLVFFAASAAADESVSEKKMAFLWAYCLFTAIVFISPKIWEDWFWDAAGLIFGIGVSLSVWALTLMLENVIAPPVRRKKRIISLLILFLACGCNQITAIAIDILITEVLLYVLISRQNRAIRCRLFYYFCAAAAGSAVCLLAPGNFYRLENGPFGYQGLPETASFLAQSVVRLYRQIRVNLIMMKEYWFLLILTCVLAGSMIKVRNRKKLILLAAGMSSAGFFSLSLNCVIDYMPSRIYAASFIWIALSAALLSVMAGSLFRTLLSGSVLPVRICSAYLFLALLTACSQIFFLYQDNHQLLRDIRSAWFYRDEQIRSIPASGDEIRQICGVPIIETNWTDIRLAEAFIANFYGLGGVEDAGVCPPFEPFSADPAQWQ